MSLLDELEQDVASRNPLGKKRKQIKDLRQKAQEAFNAQFRLHASNEQQIAFLKGRIAAFDECLELFERDEEKLLERKKLLWDDEDG